MKKTASIDSKLKALSAVQISPADEQASGVLKKSLSDSKNAVVAMAASIIAEKELIGYTEELQEAFMRFMEQPVKRDRGCLAKRAIANALYRNDVNAIGLYLQGIHHIQMEPIWGGKEDTAVELRSVSALGLVRADYPEVMIELADLLADPEVMARCAAAKAISYSERRREGVPLLRYKMLIGDQDVRVIAACMQGLLSITTDASVEFVARFLGSNNQEIRETAAMALGESRLDSALKPLRLCIEQTVEGAWRQVLTVAVALLRSESAWEYLFQTIRDGSQGRASNAIEALSNFRHDEVLRDRVMKVVATRGDDRIESIAKKAFLHFDSE